MCRALTAADERATPSALVPLPFKRSSSLRAAEADIRPVDSDGATTKADVP